MVATRTLLFGVPTAGLFVSSPLPLVSSFLGNWVSPKDLSYSKWGSCQVSATTLTLVEIDGLRLDFRGKDNKLRRAFDETPAVRGANNWGQRVL